MIGVLTNDFSLYHDLIINLKKRQLSFISLTFDELGMRDVDVIITTEQEKDSISFDNLVISNNSLDINVLIDFAILRISDDNPNILFGIDPGDSIGVAIFNNSKLIRKFTLNSPENLIDIVDNYKKAICAANIHVKIGNGARLIRNRIINEMLKRDISLEIVDESKIPNVSDDSIAASLIAKENGKIINNRFAINPKEGEIRELQRISRQKNGKITISKTLARRVLKGELTLDEALIIQQEKN